MANLQKIFKSDEAFKAYIKSFIQNPQPIQLLQVDGKKYLALGLDTETGYFLVLTVNDTSEQCRISLEKLKSPKSIAKYTNPKKLVAALSTTGWTKSKTKENSYFIKNKSLRDLVYFTYMKNENSSSKNKNQPVNTAILEYTLEKALTTAVSKNNIKGLTLWPSKNNGWQGNAQNNQGGWFVYFDKNPIKALLGALAGNIGS